MAMSSGLVVTSNGNSSTVEIAWSSDLFTVSSEQTHRYDQSDVVFLAHSDKVCDNKLSDGTSTSVTAGLSCSVIQRAVSVFPVPHAMIN